jgi:hypothetical protein
MISQKIEQQMCRASAPNAEEFDAQRPDGGAGIAMRSSLAYNV